MSFDAAPGLDSRERRAERLVIAHVVGLPVEELLPALSGSGAVLIAARAWMSRRIRRP
jgi:hypothetical protein